MKKFFKGILLAVIVTLLIAVPVLAAYTATITVTNATATGYAQLGLIATTNVQEMADNGYISASGLDTRVESAGTAIPHMLAQDSINFAYNSPASSIQTFEFTTDNTALTNFDIVLGYDGYATTLDHANLEPGSDFDMVFTNAYVDTSASNVGTLWGVYKPNALAAYVPSTGNLRAVILAADNTKTTFVGGIATYRDCFNATWLAQTFQVAADAMITSCSAWGHKQGAPGGNLNLEIWDVSGGIPSASLSATGSTPMSGIGVGVAATNIALDQPILLTAATSYAMVLHLDAGIGDAANCYRWRYAAAGGYANGQRCESADSGATWPLTGGDFDFIVYGFNETIPITLACTQAAHDVTIYADAVNFGLTIDAGNTTAAIGAGVPNVANNWTFFRNTAYADRLQFTQGVNDRIDYYPDTIIQGEAYSTGTATFTNGSTAVAGAATTWTSAMEGSVIWSATDLVSHVVSSVTDATNLVLTSNYSGAGGAGHSYVMTPCLVNEEVANSYDGAITWGTNPITVAMGILESDSTITNNPADLNPAGVAPVLNTDTNINPADAAMQGTTNFLYPLVLDISTRTNTPVVLMWAYLLMACGLAFGVWTYGFTRSTFWAGCAASVPLGFGATMQIYPAQLIGIAVIIILGGVIFNRQTA